MFKHVTFEGQFDNGHDYYSVETDVRIDTEEKELTAEMIAEIANELKQADKAQHGRSYRGELTGFYVSGIEFAEAEDDERIEYDEDDEVVILDKDYSFLNWSADKDDIEKALQD